jgi:hypothetical protein
MSLFAQIKSLPTRKFVRKVGMNLPHFLLLCHQVAEYEAQEREKWPMKKRGISSKKLSREDKVLLTLYYLRHYQTFDHLGDLFGISESYACKVYHRYRDLLVKVRRLPSWKRLLVPDLDAVLIDVTEQPIERPTKQQRDFYSGKKKRHTIKAQLIVCLATLTILVVVCGKGRTHDLTLFKRTNRGIVSSIVKYADLGYQGLPKLLANSKIPFKRSKNTSLTDEQKQYNRGLAKIRIKIEHVNRRCKIFRIVKETYRGKHKHYGKTWTLVAELVNLRYAT